MIVYVRCVIVYVCGLIVVGLTAILGLTGFLLTVLWSTGIGLTVILGFIALRVLVLS